MIQRKRYMDIVLQQSHPFSKRINIRATELERFLSPSAYTSSDDKKNKALTEWKHLWSLIWSYLMNKSKRNNIYEVYRPLLPDYERINDIPTLTSELDEVVSIQNEMVVTFHLWDYIIDFHWTLDCVAKWDWWYYIADIKTSAWKWWDEMLYSRYQCIFYTALYNLIRWINEWITKFEYWVFIKNKKKWVMQRLVRDLEISDCIEKLKFYLSSYIEKWLHE